MSIQNIIDNTIREIEVFVYGFIDIDTESKDLAFELLKDYQFNTKEALPIDQLLQQLNTLLDGHGIEAIEHKAIANVIYNSTEAVQHGYYVAEYINMGDTYVDTIVYDRVFNRLRFTCWGDYIELLEQVEAIADDLKAIANSGVIEWDEWLDARKAVAGVPPVEAIEQDEGDSYFPVRLQMYDGSFIVHIGDPSFDQNHFGQWSSDYLIQDMDDENYLELAIAMVAYIFNNY